MSASRRRRRLAAAVVALALAALPACASDPQAQAPTIGSTPEAGFVGGDGTITVVPAAEREPAPTLTGSSLDGEPIDLADHRGSIVVINVWGSWCPPCRKEAPELVSAYKQLNGAKATDPTVVFLGIDTRDTSKAAARAYERRFHVPYPSVYDPSGAQLLGFAGTLPASAIPSTLVIDENGDVAGRVIGGVTATTLTDLVDQVGRG